MASPAVPTERMLARKRKRICGRQLLVADHAVAFVIFGQRRIHVLVFADQCGVELYAQFVLQSISLVEPIYLHPVLVPFEMPCDSYQVIAAHLE